MLLVVGGVGRQSVEIRKYTKIIMAAFTGVDEGGGREGDRGRPPGCRQVSKVHLPSFCLNSISFLSYLFLETPIKFVSLHLPYEALSRSPIH